MSKIGNWFYGTSIGGLYFEFLLWLDRKHSDVKQLTPGEISTIVKQKNLIEDGVNAISKKVSTINTLSRGYDLVPLAAYDKGSNRFKTVESLKSRMDLSNVDIKTDTDKAKMIDKRINDMYELQVHRERRELVKSITIARRAGEVKKLEELKQEYIRKYGR